MQHHSTQTLNYHRCNGESRSRQKLFTFFFSTHFPLHLRSPPLLLLPTSPTRIVLFRRNNVRTMKLVGLLLDFPLFPPPSKVSSFPPPPSWKRVVSPSGEKSRFSFVQLFLNILKLVFKLFWYIYFFLSFFLLFFLTRLLLRYHTHGNEVMYQVQTNFILR